MNREEFQKELSSRFQNTESGFGNMTQRELILLQIASNMYEIEVKKFRLGAVMGRSELLLAFCTYLEKEGGSGFIDKQLLVDEFLKASNSP